MFSFITQIRICAVMLMFIFSLNAYSEGYQIDTSSSAPITGLWWNVEESGWGVALTQQFEIIFVTVYTYDVNGLPIWYVASDCRIQGDGCTGELYKVTGGSPLATTWDNSAKVTEVVGEVSFTFIDEHTGSMAITLDGVRASKLITRQIWSSLSPSAPMTALWWNEQESGWGVTLTQQTDIAFATMFTYDSNGFPVWYVASNCAVTGDSCTGTLYEVVGGSGLTQSWNGDNITTVDVGDITFDFSDTNNGGLQLTLDDFASERSITRQVWSTDRDTDKDGIGNEEDLDDDGDGLNDVVDDSPLDPFSPLGIWDESQKQIWNGDQLENATSYCQSNSRRWIAPITGFDINGDGRTEILLPISCYQGPEPLSGQKHNRQVVAAWKMFCSLGDDQHVDCTSDLFGVNEINATGTNSGGGNPYVHVMDTPRDINNDGYPDIWYTLNRDDGRPGFNFDDPEDVVLLEEFCGPNTGWTWDCTRKSIQSVLLSDTNGQYRVVQIPWGPLNTQAIAVLPNIHGTVDIMAFGSGPWMVARLVGDQFVEVAEEYESYKNIEFVRWSNPYNHVFEHDGFTYFATAEVDQSIILDPNAETLTRSTEPASRGFTLWRWIPGQGFEFSDFHVPADQDVFSYTIKSGDQIETREGASVKGVPVFSPHWHFFEYAQLSADEEPILVVAQEALGITVGDYFKAGVESGVVYEVFNLQNADKDPKNLIFGRVTVFEAFYIQDGKLVTREKSIIEGDIAYSVPGFKFEDFDGDGDLDMYGIAGGSNRGFAYLNSNGTLRRLNLREVWPKIQFTDESYDAENYGATVRKLREGSFLDFIYWGLGFQPTPEDAGEDSTYNAPDFVIVKAARSITDLSFKTPRQIQNDLQRCLTDPTNIELYCTLYQ